VPVSLSWHTGGGGTHYRCKSTYRVLRLCKNNRHSYLDQKRRYERHSEAEFGLREVHVDQPVGNDERNQEVRLDTNKHEEDLWAG
jgi:hypothetical protein